MSKSMSKSSKSSKSNSPLQSKVFCKVCFDAGKDESEFTSHSVKSMPGGGRGGVCKVICPLLLSQECRFCKKKGHTKSHCPILEQRKKEEVRYNARLEYERNVIVEKKTVDKSRKSRFEILSDENENVLKELARKIERVYPEAKIYARTYASALSSSPSQQKQEPTKVMMMSFVDKSSPPPPAVVYNGSSSGEANMSILVGPIIRKRWSEMLDTSDEEDEEEEEEEDYDW